MTLKYDKFQFCVSKARLRKYADLEMGLRVEYPDDMARADKFFQDSKHKYISSEVDIHPIFDQPGLQFADSFMLIIIKGHNVDGAKV